MKSKKTANKKIKNSFDASKWSFKWERDSNFENNANFEFIKGANEAWSKIDEKGIARVIKEVGFDDDPIMSGVYSIDFYTSESTIKQLKDLGFSEVGKVDNTQELLGIIKEQEEQDAKDRKSGKEDLNKIALPCSQCGDPSCDGSCTNQSASGNSCTCGGTGAKCTCGGNCSSGGPGCCGGSGGCGNCSSGNTP